MDNLANSHSIPEFQRDAVTFIEIVNETRDPMFLTHNDKVQAVVIDIQTFLEAEKALGRTKYADAFADGGKKI